MNVVALHPDHLDALYAIYCRAVALAPHCRFLPSAAHFHASLTHPAQRDTQIVVAAEGETAQGFAALLDRGVAEDGVREVTITALFMADERAGQALLDDCEARAHAQGIQRLRAFPTDHQRCPIPGYNAGWDELSDRIAMVGRLLARNGFAPDHRELQLECAGDRFPPAVTAPPAVGIAERVEPGQSILEATLEGQEVGVCVYNTLAALSDHPGAAQWGYIGWLHAAPELRRRGLARHLLTAALNRLYREGCTGCWLTTGADNWPAQPLYLSLGFEIVDASASFRKQLSDG